MTNECLKLICSSVSGIPFNYFKCGYETCLKEMLDNGNIKEWYYNGNYHFTGYNAKELEKESTELKAQIEKMKCCGNCKYAVYSDGICIDCSYDERFQPSGRCKDRSNWELADE